jgi:hypothetical protein
MVELHAQRSHPGCVEVPNGTKVSGASLKGYAKGLW